MSDTVEYLAMASERHELEISIRIEDGDRFAGLDVDVKALSALLFCGAIVEEVLRFGDTLYEDHAPRHFFGSMLRMSESAKKDGLSWVDCYQSRGQFAELYREIVRLRRRGRSIAASAILRLEIVEVYRENPTVPKILATGTSAAIVLLTVTFSSIQLMQERGADHCRSQAYEMAKTNMTFLSAAARREGKWTKEHSGAEDLIMMNMNTSIAACGSNLNGIQLKTKPKEGSVELSMGGDRLRNQPLQTPEAKRP
jgi:hypothetical protein